MKELYLSRKQAILLADDLAEYYKFSDSSGRHLFKGFRIQFGDMLSGEICSDQKLEMIPISDFTEIEGEDVLDNN